jgi:hypothetical protein
LSLTLPLVRHDDGRKTAILIRQKKSATIRIPKDRTVQVELSEITNPRVSGFTGNFGIRTSLRPDILAKQ